ncbi:MAG: ABC transporter permease [Acidimicrobiales bacterium]
MGAIVLRGLQLVVALFAVSAACFLLLSLLPGNPVAVLLGPYATPGAVSHLTNQLGLGRPLLERYLIWLVHALHGDLGSSYVTGQPVTSALAERLPVTLELMALSQLIALALAVPLGAWGGLHPGRALDRLTSGVSLGLLSIPGFVVGVGLVFVFSVHSHLLPATGFVPFEVSPMGNLGSLILPSATLALGSAPLYARVLRAELITTLDQDFVTAARARGLSSSAVVMRHALRPSTLTLVTVGGIHIGHLIGGAFVVEYLFGLPGVGLLTVDAIYARDYLVVIGATLVVSGGFVIVTALTDAAALLIEPRLRDARLAA